MLNYSDLIKRYKKGQNISLYLRSNSKLSKSLITKISYDLQSGFTVKTFNKSRRDLCKKVLMPVVKEIKKFKSVKTILDFGTGEMTNLSILIKNLKNVNFYANDISFNRLYSGQNFLKKEIRKKIKLKLFITDHFKLPFPDNAFDIVTSCQALEPNGSYEKVLIKELYRISKKGLVLCEPHYELGNKLIKKRMKKHGYIKNLEGLFKKLGYKHKVIRQKYSLNPVNPASIFVVNKNNKSKSKQYFVDPYNKKKLVKKDGFYINPITKRIYPTINNVTIFNDEVNIYLPKY